MMYHHDLHPARSVIVCITNGGRDIGYGHVHRIYSLAKAFLRFKQDLDILFIINKELVEFVETLAVPYILSESVEQDMACLAKVQPQLTMVDTYLLDNDYLQNIKKISRLLLFDDNNDIYDSTIPDILLNGNIYANHLSYVRNPNSLYLLGPEFLVMREEYWNLEPIHHVDKKAHRILITTGGADPYGISYHLLYHLQQLHLNKCVILGSGYDKSLIAKLEHVQDKDTTFIYMPESLKPYIIESDIVVTGGGTTVYEVLSQNVTPILFSMADNQDFACQTFWKLGIDYIGKHPQIDFHDVSKLIMNRLQNPAPPPLLNFIDGKGVFRIIEKIHL